jgi:DNA-binding NarL/FixJ family response regulator
MRVSAIVCSVTNRGMHDVDDESGMRAEPIKVLLVDGHEHVLWGLGKLIDGEWPRMMVVGRARTVTEAVRLMGRCHPDVMVMDVYAAADYGELRIEQLVRKSRPRVLVLNSARDPATACFAGRAGAGGIVGKDAPGELLLQEIERLHRAGA